MSTSVKNTAYNMDDMLHRMIRQMFLRDEQWMNYTHTHSDLNRVAYLQHRHAHKKLRDYITSEWTHKDEEIDIIMMEFYTSDAYRHWKAFYDSYAGIY